MIFQIIILGIVQGIAEFLPISSSAHLIIFRDLFGIGSKFITENISSTFDVALHLGTLIALFVVFYKDFFKMIKEGFTKGTKTDSGRLMWFLVVATIPAAIFGFLFEDIIDSVLHKQFLLIAISLIVMGIILYLSDHYSNSNNNLKKMTIKDALIIGCAQVFALIPGFSRSGTTISAGRLLKLNREDATKFSFFMSAPVVAGAVVLKLIHKETWSLIISNNLVFIIGVISSFLMGLICINFLLKYIKKHDYKIFMIYRIIIAIIVIVMIVKG